LASQQNNSRKSRRRFLRRVAAGCVVGLGAYAIGVEPRWLEVTHHEVQVPGLDSRLDGKVAVHISDTHVGKRVGDEYLKRQFDYVRSINPDFVLFTGDFLDEGTDWYIEKGQALLPFFPKGKLGTACVLGNHDFMDGHEGLAILQQTKRLLESFAEHDINVLRDEVVEFEGLAIAGLRDYWFGDFSKESAREAIASVSDRPSIVLSHNPDTVDLPIWDGYESWILCGHTHGGQCRFPLVGAPVLPVVNKNYVAGKYEIEGGHRMFITRGIGHTKRVRFMSRPEISVLTLRG